MSSFWDSIGQRLESGILTFEEIKILIKHLKAMDAVNNDVVAASLRTGYGGGYVFKDYDGLLNDVQNKGIQRGQLGWIFSNLHDFDHANDQIIMNSYNKKGDYWEKHHTFRSVMGTFKEGKWVSSKMAKEIRNEIKGKKG